MQQESWRKQPSHNPGPIDFEIKGVQFAAVMKRTDNEGDQAEDVKMDGARRIPPPGKNKQSNEEIEKADNAKKILDGERFMRRSSDQAGFKFLTVAGQFVAELRPEPGVVQPVRHNRRSGHRDVIDGEQNVPRSDSCDRRRRI